MTKTFSVAIDCVVEVEVEVEDGFTEDDYDNQRYKNAAVDQAVGMFDFAKVYGATCDF